MSKGFSSIRRSFSKERSSNSPAKEGLETDDDTLSSTPTNATAERLQDIPHTIVQLEAQTQINDDDSNEKTHLRRHSEDAKSCDSETTQKMDNLTSSLVFIPQDGEDDASSSERSSQLFLPPRSRSSATVTFATDHLISSHEGEDEPAEIQRLRDDLAQATIDHSAEKALRKKKEKNLIKLAKQLNARTIETQEKDTEIEQLKETQSILMSKLSSLKTQIDALTHESEQDARDHHAEVTNQQLKYRQTLRDADYRIAELNLSHTKQCEQLRKQLLEANVEVDRSRAQIAKLELMQKDPEEIMKRVVQETLVTRERGRWRFCSFLILAAIILPFITTIRPTYHYTNLLSYLCGPALPGTTLTESEFAISLEAPWFAPTSLKKRIFDVVCTSFPRTRIELSPGGTMTVHNIDNHSEIMVKWKVQNIVVNKDHLILRYKKATEEIVDAPWFKNRLQ